jgi:hypothetical protein
MADPNKYKHIIEGFSDDFNYIREEYTSRSPDLRLEDFFAYWRESHMDCIFANRYDPRELLESINEINRKLVSIVTNDLTQDDAKLTALYLLLCISAKQPCRLRQKIRMTCDDAIKVHKLCDRAGVSKGHGDAKFCWYHLRHTDGIDFVEERLIYGPSMLRSRTHGRDESEEPADDPSELAQKDRAEFIESKLEPALVELDNLSNHYKQMRDSLKLDGVSDATVEIESNGTLTDYVDQFKSLLRDYKASQMQ